MQAAGTPTAGAQEGLFVNQLQSAQHDLVMKLAKRLGEICEIRAVVLGGSHARGRAQPASDIDLGILYSEMLPFPVERIRQLAEEINDHPDPVVTAPYEWGPWANGGAWLTIGGQRVDFIYRSLEHIERVITDAESGRYELDYAQQPPFGFFSATYLGEIAVAVPLYDPEARVDALKKRVATYPKALRRAIVQDYLWAAEFGLAAFARKFAARGDAYGTAACLTRIVNQLLLVLFALNGRYWINDKTAVAEAEEFEYVPREFGRRVQRIFADLGETSDQLAASADYVSELVKETVNLAGVLYRPRFPLPH